MSARSLRRWSIAALAVLGSVGLVVATPGTATALGAWSPPSYVYAASSIQGKGYSYAPASIAGSVERTWSCHSRGTVNSPADVKDDIFYTRRSGGTVLSSVSVLTRSTSGWDSYHVCDPSVVRVDAPFQGHTYSYAMFYLGNDQNCSCRNSIGVALSDTLEGPWVKVGAPIVPFAAGRPSTDWGVGMPTATTINAAAGTVVLAWSEGYASTGATVAHGVMGMVSFGSGSPVLSAVHNMPTAGLYNAVGTPDKPAIFDFAYSPQRDRFYMVRERTPLPTSSPNFISTGVQVNSIAGSDLWAGTGSWTIEGALTSAVTGRDRTHNAGFLRTEYGTLPNESRVTVHYTVSDLDPDSLLSYAIYQTTATL